MKLNAKQAVAITKSHEKINFQDYDCVMDFIYSQILHTSSIGHNYVNIYVYMYNQFVKSITKDLRENGYRVIPEKSNFSRKEEKEIFKIVIKWGKKTKDDLPF